MSQLSLFGDDPSDNVPTGLEPVPPQDPSLCEIASRLPAELRLGTCSWTFPGWDIVYRRTYSSEKLFRRESLAEYAAFPLFRAVEVDSSYYAPPTAKTLRGLAERGGKLEFALKVWFELTTFVFPRHARWKERAGMRNPNFLDPSLFADQIIGPIRESGFGPLGPLIIEIPPVPTGALDASSIEQALARFLSQAPEGYRYAIETRDPTLLTERHVALLRDHGAAHVYTFHSRMPGLADQRAIAPVGAAPFAVCRLMLPPGTTYQDQKERFEPFGRIHEVQHEMRRDVAALVRDATDASVPIYVFCNNKAEGSSPLTALALASKIAGEAKTDAE